MVRNPDIYSQGASSVLTKIVNHSATHPWVSTFSFVFIQQTKRFLFLAINVGDNGFLFEVYGKVTCAYNLHFGSQEVCTP